MGYLIGETVDHYVVDIEMVIEAKEMWKQKYTILEIADRIGVHEFEAALLIMDLIRTNRAKMRPEGIVIGKRQIPPRGAKASG